MTSYVDLFAADYDEAADRFVAAATQYGMEVEEYPIKAKGPANRDLAIHSASYGLNHPNVLVVTSGLHGAEGYYGSAVQLALLQSNLIERLPKDSGLLLLHALNPFGFAWNRRWNESNVDLNRNFMPEFEKYEGCPDLYHSLNSFLNPAKPPVWPDYWPRALWNILRHGFSKIQATVPVGQYEYPKGLFFGGEQPEETHRILKQALPKLLHKAREVFHFDLHTGLGPHANCDLLLQATQDSERVARLRSTFGEDVVKADPGSSTDSQKNTRYIGRGTFEVWCRNLFSEIDYEFVTVECGTYPGATVLGHLRRENAEHHATPNLSPNCKARQCLKEAFAPASPTWRETVVRETLQFVEKYLRG